MLGFFKKLNALLSQPGLQSLFGLLKHKRTRRDVVKYFGLALGVYFFSFFKWAPVGRRFRYLRPPGALVEDEFQQKCIRCGLCGDVCPNQCIRFFEVGAGQKSGTPTSFRANKAAFYA